ncbi:major facilitator superfamily domain-containing protein [Truncatella angustata]|uniref:Major facilitator superfamily domain-containing protein n=1 Tax=Truncatella angustata TaxID=152316 RepID=A0A9P8RN12_9PEZI|nr:major facilitator superfamily domain-containing protein [Truncatella angustata]KAH6647203.1 major facilitator superfamily domain-containing protein [Truncatella angustata]
MAPVSVVPEQGPLLLDISDEHYNDVLGETIEEEDVSGSQLPDATVSSDSSRVLIQICIVTLLFDFTQYSVYAPLTEVFEEIICNNFYPAGSLQRDCKSIPVQSELALVKGYKDAFNQIPSIVLGIPLGLLADRIGRKPLILLFLLGIFLSDTWVKIVTLFPNQLPLRLVWLAPILKAVGGGANFGTSMFYTAVADIVEEKRRGDAFMKLSAMEMIVLVAGAPLISILMRINAWYPLGLSSVLLVVAGLLAMALPETHPQHRRASLELPDPVQAQASVSGNNEETQQLDSHLETVRKLMPRAYASSADLLKNPGIILSLAVFLLAAFGAHVWALLLQYVSHKFEWEFSTANLLFSLRGAITLLLSLIIMGAIDKFMQQKLGIKSAQKDLWLCTGSCILIAVGVAVVGVSQSPILMVAGVVVSALGSSLLVSLRSAMISLFPHTPMASLNAVAGMAQSLGILISGPVLAATYSWGLSQGGIWVGAPFLLASGLHFIALADIFYLRLTRAPSQVVIAHESSEA